jgi:hypothetical protein
MSIMDPRDENLAELIETVREVQVFIGRNPHRRQVAILDEVGLLDGLKECINNVPEVWVVGDQFHGKSTLVNRLIGFNVMPAGERDRREHAFITCRPTKFTTERRLLYTGPPLIEMKYYNLKAENVRNVHKLETARFKQADVRDSREEPVFIPSDDGVLSLHEKITALHDPKLVIAWVGKFFPNSDSSPSIDLNADHMDRLTIYVKFILPDDYPAFKWQYMSFVDVPGLFIDHPTDLVMPKLFDAIFDFAVRDVGEDSGNRNKCIVEAIASDFQDIHDRKGRLGGLLSVHRVFTKFDMLDHPELQQQRRKLQDSLQNKATRARGTTFMVGHLNKSDCYARQESARPEWTLAEENREDFEGVKFGLDILTQTLVSKLKVDLVKFKADIQKFTPQILLFLSKKQTLDFFMYPFLYQFYEKFVSVPGPLTPQNAIECRRNEAFKDGFVPGLNALSCFYIRLCRLLRYTLEDNIAPVMRPPKPVNDRESQNSLVGVETFEKVLNEITDAALPKLAELRETKMLKTRGFIEEQCKALERLCDGSAIILLDECELIEEVSGQLSTKSVTCTPLIDSLFKYCRDDVSKNVLQKDVRIASVCTLFWERHNSESLVDTNGVSSPVKNSSDPSYSAFRAPLISFTETVKEYLKKTLNQAFDVIISSLQRPDHHEPLPAYELLCKFIKTASVRSLFSADVEKGYGTRLCLDRAKVGLNSEWPSARWDEDVPTQVVYNDIERFLVKEFSTDPVLSREDEVNLTLVQASLQQIKKLKQESERRYGVLRHWACSEQMAGLKTLMTVVEQHSGQRITSGMSALFESAKVERSQSEKSTPIYFSEKFQENVKLISVGNKDSVHWRHSQEGGYCGSETLDDPRLLYLIRLVCDVGSLPNQQSVTVRHVYKSLPEIAHFHQQSQMRLKFPDLGRRNICSLMQDASFKKGSEYFRAYFMDKACGHLHDFFIEVGSLVREAQPDDQRLFAEELQRFFDKDHAGRNEEILKVSNDCSLVGVSASFGEEDFLKEAAKVLLDQSVVCSIETQIRASGLRSDGHLRLEMKPWLDQAMEACNCQRVEDTQQIILASASLERAKDAMKQPNLKFLKDLCTPGHALRLKFDSLCDEWEEKNENKPMMVSQKAQMAVVCFLTEQHVKKQFKSVIKEIRDVADDFFKGLGLMIHPDFLRQHSGVGWFTHHIQPIIGDETGYIIKYVQSSVSNRRGDEFLQSKLDIFFRNQLEHHEIQGPVMCRLKELINKFRARAAAAEAAAKAAAMNMDSSR